jgi:hypothetical protein
VRTWNLTYRKLSTAIWMHHCKVLSSDCCAVYLTISIIGIHYTNMTVQERY